MPTFHLPVVCTKTPAWNKGRIIGQKRPLQPKHVWAIRVRLEIADNIRDLALFNMAIDCKLRGCDLVRLKVRDVFVSGHIKERTSVMQTKTKRPVQFEITEQTRKSVQRWIESPAMLGCNDLWPSRFHDSPHLSTRQYARILRGWVTSIVWSQVPMARIRCAERKPRRFTKRPGTCGRFSFCLVTPRWTARYAIWGSSLKTRLRFPRG